MNTKKISEDLSISEQINLSDLPKLADMGFRSIICNRPDAEGDDQPTFAQIEHAAQAVNIEARYLPVVPGRVGDEDVQDFTTAMSELAKPALAYCRTGTRSATLWALSQASTKSLPDILATTSAAGYDLSSTAKRIANGGKSLKSNPLDSNA